MSFESDFQSDQPTRRGPKPQPREYIASEPTLFRLTPIERAKVEAVAQGLGSSISEFCRDAVLAKVNFHLRSES